jgi:hypothetical protein
MEAEYFSREICRHPTSRPAASWLADALPGAASDAESRYVEGVLQVSYFLCPRNSLTNAPAGQPALGLGRLRGTNVLQCGPESVIGCAE